MDSKNIVIYHSNCSDGFASAWIAKRFFDQEGMEGEYIPLGYNQDYESLGIEDLVKGNSVWVVDFSFPRDLMIKYHDVANKFVCLDHHTTAQDNCKGLDFCVFDLEKSGAMLTWEHFFPNDPPLRFIEYIQDRDLWTKKLLNIEEVSAVIRSYPKTFENYDILNNRINDNYLVVNVINEGATILRIEDSQIKETIKHKIYLKINDYTFPAVNNPNLISDTLDQLNVGEPLAAAFFLRTDGKWQFSLRSRKVNEVAIDVSSIAKGKGGGGHKQAAGFVIDFDDLKYLLVRCSITTCHDLATEKVNHQFICGKHKRWLDDFNKTN